MLMEHFEIVVVGAHLTGMPLNGDLVRLGGTFKRRVGTAPSYCLYALAGGPPKRPGLLRVADGDGRSIETEVWELPVNGFGRFVASIPEPLCIGTVRLADGTAPKGFLVEPQGLAGAVGIVTGGFPTAGMRIKVSGETAHVGPTPMERRHNALVGAAHVAVAIDDIG